MSIEQWLSNVHMKVIIKKRWIIDINNRFVQLMGKEGKKQIKKGFPLQTTTQSDAYKQQVKKQDKVLLVGSNTKLQRIMQDTPDPNYLSIFRKDYDALRQTHRLDELEDNHYEYNQKAKRDRHFDMRKEGNTQKCYNAPLTSNHEYGWRQPIDTIPTKYGMRQQYDEQLEVTLKKEKQKKA